MKHSPPCPTGTLSRWASDIQRKKQAICYKLRTKHQWLAWAVLACNGFFVPAAWLRQCLRRRSKKHPGHSSGPTNILVMRADRIGDMILALPFFMQLKKAFPLSRITCLASRTSAQLLQNNPYLDQVLTYDPPWFEGRMPWKGFSRTIHTLRVLQKERFDLAIDLRGNQFNILFLALARIPERLSYDIVPGAFLLTQSTPFLAGQHETIYCLDLLHTLTGKQHYIPPGPYLFPTSQNHRRAAQFLEECSISDRDCLIILHPGAGKGRIYKRWSAEHFITLGKKAQQEFGARIILTCSQAELKLAREIKTGIGKNVFISWDKIKNLLDLAALLSRAQALVATSTGIMHLAAATGTFVVLLSGPEDYRRWSPLGDRHVILRKDLPCSPCRETACSLDGRCLREITPAEVISALRNEISK